MFIVETKIKVHIIAQCKCNICAVFRQGEKNNSTLLVLLHSIQTMLMYEIECVALAPCGLFAGLSQAWPHGKHEPCSIGL